MCCQPYEEKYLSDIIKLIEADLSEPYSIYTYRYFLNTWPELSFLVLNASPDETLDREVQGVVIGRLLPHGHKQRGYIGMLAVHPSVRKQGLGKRLVLRAIEAMRQGGAQEIVLETETHNHAAIALYEGLGFIRDKRLCRYYLNGTDAYRLKLWLV